MGICALLLAKNEADRIIPCLESLKWVDQVVVVVDAATTDETVQICKSFGAEVVIHHWLGFAAQLRFGLEYVKQDWVLRIDADEQVSTPLRDKILHLLANKTSYVGYEINTCNLFWGRKLRAFYPDSHLRLFRTDAGHFPDKAVHEAWVPLDPKARLGHLNGDLIHNSYRSLAHCVEKWTSYAQLSAKDLAKKGPTRSIGIAIGDSLLDFIKYYILKGGFLDGAAGLTYSLVHAYYMYLRHASAYEIYKKSLDTDGK
ncbi:MAG: glycosyltransferase family 2 protein [bacterium]